MAARAAFAFFVADEVEMIELPVLFQEGYLGQRRIVPRISNYVEQVVPLYSLFEFKAHFRLSKPQVEGLLNTLGPVYQNPLNTKVPLEKCVLACLWTLANQESYRGVADRFGIGRSTLTTHLHDFCSLVNVYLAHHITWPTGEAQQQSEVGFARAGFPRTIAALDGCHIPIPKPHMENPNAYLNRKQFYSIILTAFCDSNRRFSYIHAGLPGSWHDARAFRQTAVATILAENPQTLLPPATHIIADSAYPLLLQLVKPYRDNGHLTAQQKRFNRKLHSARVTIEHVFGLLKGKFRRLRYLHMGSVQRASAAAMTCCILHNICLHTDDEVDLADVLENEVVAHEEQELPQAAQYRDAICNSL